MSWFNAFRRGRLPAARPRNEVFPTAGNVSTGLLPAGGAFDRDAALMLPSVEKSLHVLTAWGAGLNLRVYSEADVVKAAIDPSFTPEPVAEQPSFLVDRTGDFSPEMRMWRLVDDLFFYGRSLWYSRARGGIRARGNPVPIDQWTLDRDESTGIYSATLKSGDPVTRNNSVLFKIPGWSGLLWHGRQTIIGGLATEKAWVERMLSPVSLVELSIQSDEVSQTEVDAYLKDWRERRSESGGPVIGATPNGVEMKVHSGAIGDADLFLTNRNAIRNDVASHVGIDGSLADGSGGQDSLTYQTQAGIRDGFYEFDSAMFLAPILSALSQYPVTDKGLVVRPMYLPVGAPKMPDTTTAVVESTSTTTQTSNRGTR